MSEFCFRTHCTNTHAPVVTAYYTKQSNGRCPLCFNVHAPELELINPPKIVSSYCDRCGKRFSGVDYNKKCCDSICSISSELQVRPYRARVEEPISQRVEKSYFFKALVSLPRILTEISKDLTNRSGRRFPHAAHFTIFNCKTNFSIPDHILEEVKGVMEMQFPSTMDLTIIGSRMFGRTTRKYFGIQLHCFKKELRRNMIVQLILERLGFDTDDFAEVMIDGVNHLKYQTNGRYLVFADYHAPALEFDAHVTLAEVTGSEHLVTYKLQSQIPVDTAIHTVGWEISESTPKRT